MIQEEAFCATKVNLVTIHTFNFEVNRLNVKTTKQSKSFFHRSTQQPFSLKYIENTFWAIRSTFRLISDSSLHHIFESENCRFLSSYEKQPNLGSELWKIIFKNFIRWAPKIVHEWNGHLDVFSRPQVIENSRQYLLLRSDILKKTVVGFPLFSLFKTNFIFPCKHLVLNANRY